MKTFTVSLLASLVPSQATVLGAIPIFFDSYTQRIRSFLMGFGGGVMLAATAFSLIAPGIKASLSQGYSNFGAASILNAGILMGWCFLMLVERKLSVTHFLARKEKVFSYSLHRIWLFIISISLHNFPEGLAVGIGFGSDSIDNNMALAAGIALQNIPEGLIVASLLKSLDYSTAYVLEITFLTGLVEMFGSIVGGLSIRIVEPLLPWSMAFAAGSMLYALINEILPETYYENSGKKIYPGIMAGFMTMTFLDMILTKN